MEYINISNNKESVTIKIAGARGITWDDNTISALSDCFITPSLKIDFSECASQL